MGPKAAPAIPQLVRTLTDPVGYVAASAAAALGAMGPAARAAVHPLVERLQAKSERGIVLSAVASALGDIGPERARRFPLSSRPSRRTA